MKYRYLSGALAMVIVACAILVAPDRASACSCATPAGVSQKELVRQELVGSDAVFSGEVVGTDMPPSGPSSTEPMGITFQVSEWWKGPGSETVDVQTAASEVSCGYPFNEGVDYLVFAYEEGAGDGEPEVGLCGSTSPLSEAGTTLAIIGSTGAEVGPHPAGDRLPDTSGARGAQSGLGSSSVLAVGVVALVLSVATMRVVARLRR